MRHRPRLTPDLRNVTCTLPCRLVDQPTLAPTTCPCGHGADQHEAIEANLPLGRWSFCCHACLDTGLRWEVGGWPDPDATDMRPAVVVADLLCIHCGWGDKVWHTAPTVDYNAAPHPDPSRADRSNVDRRRCRNPEVIVLSSQVIERRNPRPHR